MTSAYTSVTLAERPDLIGAVLELNDSSWDEFVRNDAVSARRGNEIYVIFPEYQVAVIEASTRRLAAVGNSVPLAWDDDGSVLPDRGWDWALEEAFRNRGSGQRPATQCALSVSIGEGDRGRGIGAVALEAMKEAGARQGLERMVAPVRPVLKSRYPLTPMERYVDWRRDDGDAFDPWIRVHERAGGEIARICRESMRVEGNVSDWESWTGMRFPESGHYVVPGALVPVGIDVERDTGLYLEPNVWMVHTL
ncbi:MAG: GNAT family N-acetyltransferase [Candidatus Eisenbacteria bacterium]|nr:GNAT family N-acetyltransferase [Candidatus Eisenbacteria bacterium]